MDRSRARWAVVAVHRPPPGQVVVTHRVRRFEVRDNELRLWEGRFRPVKYAPEEWLWAEIERSLNE